MQKDCKRKKVKLSSLRVIKACLFHETLALGSQSGNSQPTFFMEKPVNEPSSCLLDNIHYQP